MNDENMSMLYVFHSRKHTGRRIVIYACSYLEAKQAMGQYALNDNEFDLNEFQLYKVPADKLLNVLKLEDDYTSYQYKLSEEQFKKLSKHIANKKETCLIESVNSRVRHYLARLNRKQELDVRQWNVYIPIGQLMSECLLKEGLNVIVNL